MRLHTFRDHFVVEPDRGLDGASLLVDRRSGALSRPTRDALDAMDFTVAHSQFVHAVIGVARLLRGRYLVVASGAEPAASLPGGHTVRRVTDALVLPFSAGDERSDLPGPDDRDDERRYVEMLHAVLGCGAFFFCTTWDLTHSFQRLAAKADRPRAPARAYEACDPRFFWNMHLSAELVAAGMHEFVTPIVQAFVTARELELHGRPITFALISRRSWRRAGKRYTTRGLDADGNAANYAETEQILYVPDGPGAWRVMSYVQTRGSVPVVWRQPVSLKYMPKPEFDSPARALAATRKHFEEQVLLYGRQTCVSLVNQKGKELAVHQAYADAVGALSNKAVRFVPFDFHHECSKMRYENLSKLVAEVDGEFAAQGYWSGSLEARGDAMPAVEEDRAQAGVFRTNCMDNLDRTNVVQGLFARRVLEAQLAEANVLTLRHRGRGFASDGFEHVFKNVWADNADAMSMQYAGSGAQKTDYTRTGKRTKLGALQDLRTSVRRYVNNNFYDGTYQDALSLFLGRFTPELGRPSPLAALRDPKRPRLSRHLAKVAAVLMVALAVVFAVVGPYAGLPVPSSSAIAMLYAILLPVVAFKASERVGRKYVVVPLLGGDPPYETDAAGRAKSD